LLGNKRKIQARSQVRRTLDSRIDHPKWPDMIVIQQLFASKVRPRAVPFAFARG
jgi:hypothetical protein